jgi:predicted ArsR family transcriptional regulator
MRIAGPLSVPELADAMEVTATAVRQRLTRLLGQSMIQREAIRAGRGRPKHRYWLTDKGLRQTGSNFTDLAVALWSEMQTIENEEMKREVLRRISRALATGYAAQIQGATPAERLQSLGSLLNQRRIPVSVSATDDGGAKLTAHACPYPNISEKDTDICKMERMMFSQLIGQELELKQCRHDGDSECCFEAAGSKSAIAASAGELGDAQNNASGSGSHQGSDHNTAGGNSVSSGNGVAKAIHQLH